MHERRSIVLPTLLIAVVGITSFVLFWGRTLTINDLVASGGADLRASCERANVARQQQLALYDALILGNLRRAGAWDRRPHDDPTFAQADRLQVRANRDEANALRTAERAYVDSQATVSAHPRAANLHRRAVVDCFKAFP